MVMPTSVDWSASSAARNYFGMGMISECFAPQSEFVVTPKSASAASGQRERWKREDCEFVKHDSCFSDWKVLVGPSDWNEHASGKEGAERFCVRNLPINSYPGVYELGVISPSWLPLPKGGNHSSGTFQPQDVVAVYVGHADNLRRRLQRYGQAGAHLEGPRSTRLLVIHNDPASTWNTEKLQNINGKCTSTIALTGDRQISANYSMSMSTIDQQIGNNLRRLRTSGTRGGGSVDESSPESSINTGPFSPRGILSPRGPRLFTEVFALGCSIAFRWAKTDSKEVAEKVEAELISVFDYAWNQREDFYGRSRDILAKIVMGPPRGHGLMYYLGYGSRWNRLLYTKKGVDISIAVSKPTETWWEQFHNSSKMQIKVGDLLVMLKKFPPCRLTRKSAKNSQFTNLDIPVERCGVPLKTGQRCSAFPIRGQKHCLMHKDVKKASKKAAKKHPTSQGDHVVQNPKAFDKESCHQHRAASTHLTLLFVSCFPYFAAANMQQPQDQQETRKRRGSLSFNTWLQTSQVQRPASKEWMAPTEGMHSSVGGTEGWHPASLIGGQFPDQLLGGKKTISHNRALSTCIESQSESCKSSGRQGICGLKLNDNTVCTATSQPNRRRCFTHQGLQSPTTAPWSPEAEIWSPGKQSFSLQFSLQT